jgi:hypothetical protein
MLVTRYVVSARATRFVTEFLARSSVWPRCTRSSGRSARVSPPLLKRVYADAISNGVASKTPSAIDGNARGAVPAPIRFQSAAMRSNPAVSATFTVAALRDSASARRSVMSPSYSFS